MICSAVIFDMDGVILNTEAVCRRAWHAAGPRFGLSYDDVEKSYEAGIGCSMPDTRDMLRGLFGTDFAAESYIEASTAEFHVIEEKEGLPLMKGVQSALEYLKRQGYRIALASSTHGATVRRQLTAAGVLQWFETVTTGDMVTHSKPDPEIYRMACRSLELAPADCAAVEDSPNGILSASRAGMKCIMVPDQIQPSATIKKFLWQQIPSLEEIPSIL